MRLALLGEGFVECRQWFAIEAGAGHYGKLLVGQLAFTERFKQVGADVELARLKVGL